MVPNPIPAFAGRTVSFSPKPGRESWWARREAAVVETGPGLRQYAVRMDGSRNVSRKFLRPFTGVADMMAEDVVHSNLVLQQYPDDVGGHPILPK